jgi:hypothetical protein
MQLGGAIVVFLFSQALVIQFTTFGSFFSSVGLTVIVAGWIFGTVLTPVPGVTALLSTIFRHCGILLSQQYFGNICAIPSS